MRKFRKILALLLCMMMGLSLASCGGKEDEGEEKSEETSEGSEDVDLSAFAGDWKYDDYPIVLTINKNGKWTSKNSAGGQDFSGTIVADGDGFLL